jgi:hypothetical protein
MQYQCAEQQVAFRVKRGCHKSRSRACCLQLSWCIGAIAISRSVETAKQSHVRVAAQRTSCKVGMARQLRAKAFHKMKYVDQHAHEVVLQEGTYVDISRPSSPTSLCGALQSSRCRQKPKVYNYVLCGFQLSRAFVSACM